MKKNKAVHKGNGLLPYPVIVSASQGDILAMNVVLCHYEPYIARLSMRTSIDELENTFTLAAQAAMQGAKNTEAIAARMGRAGTVGNRSIGYPDAGAYALGVIFTELKEELVF